MSKINIRSPYYVTVSDTGLESLQIELWVYTGTRTPFNYPNTTPTYTLTTTAIDDSATFEISELIKDYLDSTFDGTYTSSAVFVDYRLTKTVSGVTSVVPQVFQKEAYDGYGYFSDGANPQNRNALLVSSPTIYKMKDEDLTFPYNIGSDLSISVFGNVNQVTFTATGFSYTGADGIWQITSSDLFSSSSPLPSVGDTLTKSNTEYVVTSIDESVNKIFVDPVTSADFNEPLTFTYSVSDYYYFDDSDADNTSANIIRYLTLSDIDRILSTTDSVTTIHNVVEIEECRNTPYKLTFVNKFGALEDIWFYGASRENTNTTKEDYKSNIVSAGSYSINEHQRKILNKNGIDSMVINSNFYPEEHNETFKQLFLSEKVWITYKTQVLPIQITSNTISFKNRLNDKLINYEINIEFSNNTINNIR
ncbi:hypothetical protein [uncultured Mediterranean phage uvMED]|nr:hypothetical protein [uncultured Mediterranean phage uvMED]